MTQKTTRCTFWLNGKKVLLDEFDPTVTLASYLRGINLTGTKIGCGEGGCGACTVMLSRYEKETGRVTHAAVNACLMPLGSVHGKVCNDLPGDWPHREP